MEFEQRQSGVLIPTVPRKPPKETRFPYQIECPEKREQAKQGLKLLWDAMGLESPGGLVVGDKSQYGLYWDLWHTMGETLLGDDCPEMAVLC